MCSNIRGLSIFSRPTRRPQCAREALQYVRKVSGLTRRFADKEALDLAVEEVAAPRSADRVLKERSPCATREGGRPKARARFAAAWRRLD